jgi:tripartite-type tricarboxylate transporter receptor subunit TctC
VAESGVAGFDMAAWLGIVGPAGMAPALVRQLNTELTRVLNAQAIRDRFTQLGMDVTPSTPEEFGTFLKAELVKWGQAVKESGAKAE